MEHHASQQAGAIRLEKTIERTGQHVIPILSAVHQGGIVFDGPLLDGIQGVALDDDVLEQQQDRLGVARISHCLGQVGQKPHALDPLIEDGNGVRPIRPARLD